MDKHLDATTKPGRGDEETAGRSNFVSSARRGG